MCTACRLDKGRQDFEQRKQCIQAPPKPIECWFEVRSASLSESRQMRPTGLDIGRFANIVVIVTSQKLAYLCEDIRI
jgi:hypothetical protein